MDFYGYWQEKREAAKYRLAVPPIGINTTFFFQDNGPGLGHLKFIKNGHLIEPPHLYPIDRPNFLVLEWHWLERPHWNELVITDEPIIQDGHIKIPEKPGLGVELNDEAAKKYLKSETGFFE